MRRGFNQDAWCRQANEGPQKGKESSMTPRGSPHGREPGIFQQTVVLKAVTLLGKRPDRKEKGAEDPQKSSEGGEVGEMGGNPGEGRGSQKSRKK